MLIKLVYETQWDCMETMLVSIECSINIIILLPTPFKLDKTELPRLLYISLGCSKHATELRLGECRHTGFLLFLTDHCPRRHLLYFSVSRRGSSY